VKAQRRKKPSPPLAEESLERLGLFYAGRYATTRAKLKTYLTRKLKERGWDGVRAPDVDALVDRFAALGYVDDRAFADARAASLQRRGYGERRVDQALYAAGIDDEDAAPAREQARSGAWDAALRFAQRRRIGPFAAEAPDPKTRQRAFGAMLRAGHPLELVRKLLNASPGDIPDSDVT
jgi:regulatory protein